MPERLRTLFQQFARLPVEGAVKQRLQRTLGPRAACDAHRQLMMTATDQLARVAPRQTLELWLDRGGEDPAVAHCRARGSGRVYLQRGRDLGVRMAGALRGGLDRADAVVLVGSDCPYFDPPWLQEAADRLRHHALVIGPAEDGGYVLVAVRGAVPAGLFDDVRWGEATVLEETLARARAAGVEPALLAPRADVDRPEDLDRWRGGLSRLPAGP